MKYDFEFVKYHGCGNDFILKDEMNGPITPDEHRSRMAKLLSDRNFWIGADGILFVERAPGVDGSMRLFEPAGNEADMCGNGLRCVAAFLTRKLAKTQVDVLTRDGVKRAARVGDEYKVDMGVVRTRRADLAQYLTDPGSPDDSTLELSLTMDRKKLKASLLNTGEPHIVVQSDDLDSIDMVKAGEAVNRETRRFPKHVNLNYIRVTGPHDISVRTYERGVFGETLACGTGVTACASAALMLHLVEPGVVNVSARGGRIRVELGPDGRAFMTGPAVAVYEGRLEIEV